MTTNAPASVITVGSIRQEIDQIDKDIASLLKRRREVSRLAQDIRLNAGDGRVDLARERQIIDNYQDLLGTNWGQAWAVKVLDYSKGF